MIVNGNEGLRQCPFCGSPAKSENTVTEFVIRCGASWCGATIKRRHASHDDAIAIERATRAWNDRR